VKLASGFRFILSDTVGFISDLPTMLVAAFRATLEEVVSADLLLHVRDISHGHSAAQRADVDAVLSDLGIEPAGLESAGLESRVLEVWNKIDRLPPERLAEVVNVARRTDPPPALVSARTGAGLAELVPAIEARLTQRSEVLQLELPPGAGRLAHWLHENTAVLERRLAEDGATRMRIRIDPAKRARLDAQLAKAGLARTAPPRRSG
jgi:GTPase